MTFNEELDQKSSEKFFGVATALRVLSMLRLQTVYLSHTLLSASLMSMMKN